MSNVKAWVISVDMGYGHQRAAYPLKDIAYERIITANSDKIISSKEKKLWRQSRGFYETISRMKKIPVVGESLHKIFDTVSLSISPFFPFRDLSKPVLGVFMLMNSVKQGLSKSLIDYVKKKDIPFIATHPIPAIAAYYHGLKKIYCVVTDTDIHRAWVIENPKENTITYFSPTVHASVRLREYGIQENKIIFTGFPLPKENIGGKNYSILKKDLGERIANLDPNKVFIKGHKDILKKKLGKYFKEKNSRPLTIAFLIGGAGAQKEIGVRMIKSLRTRIVNNQVKINLVAGIRLDVISFFKKEIEKLGLKTQLGKNINIIFALSKKGYFEKFNATLHTTDIIWTKPSEMSFYTALGFPVIIAPPIGSHEKYNREWLQHMGSGFVQENPDFTNDWLFYWLENGRLAEAALEGWIKAPTLGAYKIEDYLKKHI